jgi:carbamoyltransferase
MDSKIISMHGGHDSSITFIDKDDQIRIFEYERFCKKRYAMFTFDVDNYIESESEINNQNKSRFIDYVRTLLKEEPTIFLYTDLNNDDISFLKMKFPYCNFYRMGHHLAHCTSGYYTSGFDSAIAISLDGGGYDYVSEEQLALRTYSIYKFENNDHQLLKHSNDESQFLFNPGIYGSLAYFVSEIKKEYKNNGEPNKFALSYAGKIMGLSAYGNVRYDWMEGIRNFYFHHPEEYWHPRTGRFIFDRLSEELGTNLTENCFDGQDSYDLAATNQKVFEELCFSLINPIIDDYNLDIVLTGGCALNVVFNEKLKKYLDTKNLKLYIPPFPNDSGLSFGNFIYSQGKSVDITPYCGLDILDRERIFKYYDRYSKSEKVEISTPNKIVNLITQGKIGAIISGYSEVGPRALGNRSIICDPSYPNMKDIINENVKFREWFRPFAPVCRLEDKDLYFQNPSESPYMTFTPKVKEEYTSELFSVVHEDETGRLQTVTSGQHRLFYDILTIMKKRNLNPIILNTSFNIKGSPILTTIEDAFFVLENTKLDFLVVENLLFNK